MSNPMGIDNRRPDFSWCVSAEGRARSQSRYRLVVARGADPVEHPESLVWDSGDVDSDATVDIQYNGEALVPRTRYHWRVRVSDESGRMSAWSQPAWFEIGLLEPSDWSARWIGSGTVPRSQHLPSLENLARIWVSRTADAVGSDSAWFRTRFTVPGGVRALAAPIVVSGVEDAAVYLNGARVGVRTVDGSAVGDAIDDIRPGANLLAIAGRAIEGLPGGLLVRLDVLLANDARAAHLVAVQPEPAVVVVSNGRWRGTADRSLGWHKPDFDDAAWPLVEEVGLHSDPPWGRERVADRPSPYLRREFEVKAGLRRATIYATALGAFELLLNGERVGTDFFAPGWTDYNKRVAYQTYDVTDVLRVGSNVLGAILADGWYAGNVCWLGPYRYGSKLQLRAELHIDYEDGSATSVVTDEAWRVGNGVIRYADLQNGEAHDARMEPEGWASPGYDDRNWQHAVLLSGTDGRTEAMASPPIVIHQEVPPKDVRQVAEGIWIVDFGQNLVGWVQLKVRAESGRRIVVRHGEVLQADGMLYTQNLRSARATDEYILRGGADEICQPRFTFHGFRYAEISGWPGRLETSMVVAMVVYADLEATGTFRCSNPLLNRLQENIVWSQRGNFLAVPADCPQRDERLGWTGDAQIFASTAAFNMDVQRFFRKWLRDIADAQYPNGAIAHVAPDVLTGRRPEGAEHEGGAPGWGDVIVVLPSQLYRTYGDERIIDEVYEAMCKWLDFYKHSEQDGVFPDRGIGDWLNIGAETPKDLIGTAFHASSAKLLSQLARVAGHDKDVQHYEATYRRVRATFRERYLVGRGQVRSGTQCAYVLALWAGMFEDHELSHATANLVRDIEARGWHLSTGFLGTPFLLDALTSIGCLGIAYKLLLQETFPSWLCPIVEGDATTMWERWDSWSQHRGVQDPAMNSFNHYAYGAVGDWLYRTVLGIEPATPGYRRIRIRPRPSGGLSWAEGSFRSVRGEVRVRWDLSETLFDLRITLPANTSGEIWIPASAESVRESGQPVIKSDQVHVSRDDNGWLVLDVGSGSYRFTAPAAAPRLVAT